MTDLVDIEGVGDTHAAKLRAAGAGTVEALLEKGATPSGRTALGETTGIAAAHVLKWVNHADLFRIKGVGGEYAELLEAAGVDSVAELAQRNAVNLTTKLAETNATKNLVRQLPAESQVTAWIAEAAALPRMVHH